MGSKTLSVVGALFAGMATAWCQTTDTSGVPVRTVVTVEGKGVSASAPLSREDVVVWQGKDRRPVTRWTAFQGDHAGLQLWLLIDDSLNSNFGTQFGDLRTFINGLPASAQLGVGYIRNGTVEAVGPMGADHARAAKAIRLPEGIGGGSASPYISLRELIKKWPETQDRREVLMITPGIDFYYGPGPEDPYLLSAISEAQRAGVIVSSIYYGAFGHLGHDMWQINWGQNDLAELCDATGGEAYWQGFINPVSLAPFLDDFTQRLANQYELTFLAKPDKKGGLEKIRVTTEVPRVSIVTESRVYVPGD